MPEIPYSVAFKTLASTAFEAFVVSQPAGTISQVLVCAECKIRFDLAI